MTLLLAIVPGHVLDDAKRPLFVLLCGFIVTFIVVRVNTRLARRRGGSGPHFRSVVTPGGLHIHHAVFGVIGMVVAGILEFSAQPGSPLVEFIAFAFGAGAALTLDEFALILHLEDVYWTGEGRKSIDAIILGVTFITLLLTGLLPRQFNELGDYITLSRWALSGLIFVGAFFVVVCYLKGKLFVGTIGIFFPPLALVGALRLAKPGSPWARSQYAANAVKMERALRRDERFHQLVERRKHAVWDLIGGKPHLSLPRRDGHHRDRGHGPKGGSRESHV